jgi:hypothetical protein
MEAILAGTTDRSILVFIPDPASTTGQGKTGLNAAALTVTYTRVETDNDVVHTDVTSSLNDLSALTDAHNDWGVKEVSSTLSKGLYRLDIADAVFATGAWYAVVQVTITSGTAAATPKAFRLYDYDPSTGVKLGNIAHGGTSAVLTIERLIAASTTSNEPAMKLTGNGSASGLLSTGGATGHGAKFTGGATSGSGIHSSAPTSGYGIYAVSLGDNGSGFHGQGFGDGAGMLLYGGTNGDGLACQGHKAGGGIVAHGGADGGAGSGAGPGMFANASATGPGMQISGGPTGTTTSHGLVINGDFGDAIGLYIRGAGAYPAIHLAGGATGHGIDVRGGTTSGDGINITTTSGHGVSIAATGTSKHGVTITGGNGGTSDGLKLTAGTGGVGLRLDTLTASGAVALSSTLTVTGATTFTGAVSATNASNDIRGARLSAAGVDDIWDEAFSGHLTVGTFGQVLAPIRTGTAQAGGATTITLDASASATDDIYNYDLIVITGGTGAGQSRFVTDYNGTTKVATVASWQTNPSSDSVFLILPGGQIPGGGGIADWTADERTALRSILGIPASGTTPDDPTTGILDTIRDSVATRASQASVDTIDNFLDTEIASIISTLGTPAGASISADILVIDNLVDDLEGRLTSARAGYLDNINNANLANVPAFPSNFASLGINASGHISRVVLVDTLTTYTSNTPQTGDSFARIGAAGAGLTAVPWNASWDAEVQSEVVDALQETIPDSVPADGTRPSVQSALYMMCQGLFEGSISGTTWTIKKVDGSTTLFTVTLDSSTTPTSKTRA